MTRAGALLLAALLLSAGSLLLHAPPATADAPAEPPVARAAAWLRSVQRADGTFPGASTMDAVIGLAAAGVDPREVRKGPDGATAVDALAAARQYYRTTAHWEMGLLAVVAAGEDPRAFRGVDYVAKVREGFTQGQFGDVASINDDIFGILALRAVGAPPDDTQIQAARTVVLANQNVDGGWSAGGSLKGTPSGPDLTGVAILSLIEAGAAPTDRAVGDGLAYLRAQQDPSGGFLLQGKPNTQSTAWALQGLLAAGEDPSAPSWRPAGKGPVDFLLAQQIAEGGIRQGAAWPDAWATAQSLVSLTGASYRTSPFTPLTLTFDPPTPRAGSPVTIKGHLAAGERLVSARLDLGDGTLQEKATHVHAYAAPGAYGITLTVHTERGARAFATAPLRVLPALHPALAAPAEPVARGEPVLLDAGASRDPASGGLAYRFDAGDGNATAWGSDPRYEHAYSAPGTYTARVTVRGEDGATATAARTVTVLNRAPETQLTGPLEADRATDASFTLLALDPEGDAVTVTWRVDNVPVTAEGTTLAWRFATLGEHQVTATARDAFGATVAASHTVRVVNLAPRIERASATQPEPGAPVRLTAEAADSDGGAPRVRWLLEGALLAEGASAEAALPEGAHTLTVEAVDADGAAATLALPVQVRAAPQEAPAEDTEPTPPAAPAPRLLTATAEPLPEGRLALAATVADATDATRVRYVVRVGDAAPVMLEAARPTFAVEVGPFPRGVLVTVEASLAGAPGDVLVLSRAFPANRAPAVVLTASAPSVWAGGNVTFTATATDPDGDVVTPTFLHGNLSTEGAALTLRLDAPGEHEITVIARDPHGGEATARVTVHVRERPADPEPIPETEPERDPAPEPDLTATPGPEPGPEPAPEIVALREAPAPGVALWSAAVALLALAARSRRRG